MDFREVKLRHVTKEEPSQQVVELEKILLKATERGDVFIAALAKQDLKMLKSPPTPPSLYLPPSSSISWANRADVERAMNLARDPKVNYSSASEEVKAFKFLFEAESHGSPDTQMFAKAIIRKLTAVPDETRSDIERGKDSQSVVEAFKTLSVAKAHEDLDPGSGSSSSTKNQFSLTIGDGPGWYCTDPASLGPLPEGYFWGAHSYGGGPDGSIIENPPYSQAPMYCHHCGTFLDHMTKNCPHKDDDGFVGYHPFKQTPREMFDIKKFLPVEPEYVAEEGSFQLKVKVYDRDTIAFPKTITVEVESSDTVYNLKVKLQEKGCLPPDDQMLWSGCGGLKDDDAVLAYYKIQKNSTLELQYAPDDPDFYIQLRSDFTKRGLDYDAFLKAKKTRKASSQIVGT